MAGVAPADLLEMRLDGGCLDIAGGPTWDSSIEWENAACRAVTESVVEVAAVLTGAPVLLWDSSVLAGLPLLAVVGSA